MSVNAKAEQRHFWQRKSDTERMSKTKKDRLRMKEIQNEGERQEERDGEENKQTNTQNGTLKKGKGTTVPIPSVKMTYDNTKQRISNPAKESLNGSFTRLQCRSR